MLTTVARFREPWEAHMLRGRLEAEGIAATVAHENHIWTVWPYSNALGGVKVQVPDSQGDAARSIEQDCRRGVFHELLRAELSDIDDIQCVSCGGTAFAQRRPAFEVLVVGMMYVLGMPMPAFTWIRTCKRCGTQQQSAA